MNARVDNMRPAVADDRRVKRDRRAHLDHAATLAVAIVELRALLDTESKALTAAQRDVELLRTPTAPDVQRETALEHLRQELERLHQTNSAFGEAMQRLREVIAHRDRAQPPEVD